MRSILALAPLILVPACGEDTAPQDSAPEAYDQVWVHVIEGCVPEPEANCEPSLHLCAGGRAYTQVTDIVNIGSWSAGEGTIVTTFPAADVPETWVFTASESGATLTDDWLGWAWEPWEEPAVRHCG
ncbi:MAG: hypothetical protein ABIO70_30470 [Pseudomonadota bacterium]